VTVSESSSFCPLPLVKKRQLSLVLVGQKVEPTLTSEFY
jgi:hypothetical protein